MWLCNFDPGLFLILKSKTQMGIYFFEYVDLRYSFIGFCTALIARFNGFKMLHFFFFPTCNYCLFDLSNSSIGNQSSKATWPKTSIFFTVFPLFDHLLCPSITFVHIFLRRQQPINARAADFIIQQSSSFGRRKEL